MGIWDAMNSTAEVVRRQLPDPAPLKNVCSSAYGHGASAVNRARAVLPDLSTASWICRRSYDGGSTAAAWLYRTVRVDAPHQIRDIVSEPQAQERIGRTAWNLLDHTLEHGTRAYTGGIPVYRILKEGFSDGRPAQAGKEMNKMRGRLENLEALVEARGTEKVAGKGLVGSGAPGISHRMVGASKPKDVIGSFMSGGFTGGDFINEQVIPVNDESRRKATKDFLVRSGGTQSKPS